MELDALNPLRDHSTASELAARGISAVGLMNSSSLFSTSRAMQETLASMKPFGSLLTNCASMDYVQQLSLIPEFVNCNMGIHCCTSAMKDAMALRNIVGIGAIEHMSKRIGGGTLQSLNQSSGHFSGMYKIENTIAERASLGLGIVDTITKAMGASYMPLVGVTALQESLGFRMSSVQNALKTMHQSMAFSDADYIAKVIGPFTHSQVLKDSIIALNQEGIFQEALNHYNSVSYVLPHETERLDEELADIITDFDLVEKSNFLEFFRKLPPLLQASIIFFFLQTIWPMVVNIASNLITPQVERMINRGKLTTDQIRVVKKLPASQGIDIESLRFITHNNVKLRAKASTKSEVLDELVVGQVVTILGRKKNWAEVAYRYEDGQAFHGWILTTYTAKFKLFGKLH